MVYEWGSVLHNILKLMIRKSYIRGKASREALKRERIDKRHPRPSREDCYLDGWIDCSTYNGKGLDVEFILSRTNIRL